MVMIITAMNATKIILLDITPLFYRYLRRFQTHTITLINSGYGMCLGILCLDVSYKFTYMSTIGPNKVSHKCLRYIDGIKMNAEEAS